MAYISYLEKGAEKHYQIPEDHMIIFGREEHTDFQILQDSQISREHFCIERGPDGRFSLMDLGSSNGTFLNDRRVEPNGIRWLKHGDTVKVGRQHFTFREKLDSRPTQQRRTGGVLHEMQKGKGYHTILCEIIGQTPKGKPKPAAPATPAGDTPDAPAPPAKPEKSEPTEEKQ